MTRTLTLSTTLLLTYFAHAVTVSVSGTDATCGQCNGVVTADAQGGLPPYTYLWSPIPPAGQGTPQVQGLCPGNYSVEVTDGLGNTAQADFTVLNNNNLLPGSGWQMLADCQNSCSAWFQLTTNGMGGTAPYTVDFPFPQPMGTTDFMLMGLCSGSTYITVTDANGCIGTVEAWISNADPGHPNIIGSSPACDGQANGSVTTSGFGSGYLTLKVVAAGAGAFATGQVVEYTDAPYVVTGLAAGNYDMYFWDPQALPPAYQPAPVYCTEGTTFTIGSLPGPCGTIQGTVYHDADQDCTFNGFDLKQPYRVLSIAPGGAFAISDGNGHYQQNLDHGSYIISQGATPNETQLCPVANPAPFTLDAGNTSATIDFANLSAVPHDLSLSLSSSNARPGFPTQVWITVQNNSAFPSGNVSIDLSFDGLLLNPNPASGQWALGTMAPYAHATHHFTANVPANINLLGTVMNYTATVTNSASEANTANNVASLDVTITGSYDPNSKEAQTSSGVGDLNEPYLYFPIYDDWIDYTVHFQNTGTAAAETVVLRDLVDANLSIPSIEIIGASHAFTPSFSSTEPRELVLTFADINLPDSATDLLGSQGFFSYRIKPNVDVAIGTVIENTAGIYFDLNPPIVTNTTQHVVSLTVGISGLGAETLRVSPNPTSDVLNVVLPEGSGAALQVLSVDGRMVEVPTVRRSNSILLDVRSLAPGTYVVHTTAGTARFLKY